MHSDAKTIEAYLAELPAERRQAISAVRQVVLDNLPPGYEEAMNWGMITYQVPLETYPDTYNGQPLMYAALASQKNYMAIYLTGIYMNDHTSQDFESAYKATGKRYDVGKSCVRFRKLDDLPLELVGQVISQFDIEEFIQQYNQARKANRARKK